MNQIKNNLIQKIENRINKENIKMKPKWYFIFKSILNISFVLILLLAIIYLGNFIYFIFYDHKSILDSFHLNFFEMKNFFDFLKIIPIILILLAIVFIISLYKLIDEYSFVYRKRKFYMIFGLFIFIILAVFSVHMFLDKDFKMARFGERGELPLLQNIHRHYRGDNFLQNPPLPPIPQDRIDIYQPGTQIHQ